MRVELRTVSALALIVLAAGCAPREGRRSTAASRQLVVASGLEVVELALPPADEVRPEGRLFADVGGEPLLVGPRALVSLHDGAHIAHDLPGASSAVALDDGQWLAAAGGAVHLMRGSQRVHSRRVAGEGISVQVAPAGVVVVYVAAGSTLALIDSAGRVRPLARFRSPITAIAGTGDLSFVALASGSVWMLRLGERPAPLHRHRSRIDAMALDPNGYLVFADELTVYAMLGGRPLPLVAGLAHPQLAASRDGVFVYSAEQRRLLAVRGVVEVEAAVTR